jgi:hypothetical protein
LGLSSGEDCFELSSICSQNFGSDIGTSYRCPGVFACESQADHVLDHGIEVAIALDDAGFSTSKVILFGIRDSTSLWLSDFCIGVLWILVGWL